MPSSGGRPWAWVPTLYFAQGLPNAIATTVAVVLYERLGLSATETAFHTSWLYVPWVAKFMWAPLVEVYGRARSWVLGGQLALAGVLVALGLSLGSAAFLPLSLACFWLLTLCSATHDIAADGFYMQALVERQQALFIGIRNTFFRLALIAGQGGLLKLAGALETQGAGVVPAWRTAFFAAGAALALLALWHAWAMPRPSSGAQSTEAEHAGARALPAGDVVRAGAAWRATRASFASFFARPALGRVLAYLVLYRFAEAQLAKIAPIFLVEERALGGLGLSTERLAEIYAGLGPALLLTGGILGSFVCARDGLRAWRWPMAFALNVPNLVYVYLALAQPTSSWTIAACVGLEQFGYGFGFCAYMLSLLALCAGPHRTSHYALCTGFMALGMMLPGMVSGRIADELGYAAFFGWVCVATLPSFAVCALVPLDPEFGKRT